MNTRGVISRRPGLAVFRKRDTVYNSNENSASKVLLYHT